jgi:site-specific DNA-adenine methylase
MCVILFSLWFDTNSLLRVLYVMVAEDKNHKVKEQEKRLEKLRATSVYQELREEFSELPKELKVTALAVLISFYIFSSVLFRTFLLYL